MRRIVTGPGQDGRPAIILDGEPPTTVEFGQYRTTELWVTENSPPAIVRTGDPSTRPWALEPPRGGHCFRIVTIAPEAAEAETEPAADPQEAEADFLGEHETSTLDYVVVLSGQVTLTVGDSSVVLGPGDAVVQQAVAHDWRNYGTEPCVVAALLASTQ